MAPSSAAMDLLQEEVDPQPGSRRRSSQTKVGAVGSCLGKTSSLVLTIFNLKSTFFDLPFDAAADARAGPSMDDSSSVLAFLETLRKSFQLFFLYFFVSHFLTS